MAKKSQRRSVRYEKDKSGCMWGFISMFDFRHGRSARKLIADKRRSSKHGVGVAHSNKKFEMLSNLNKDCQANFDREESKRPAVKTDANKPSVKKLIEEEMFIDQNAMKDVGYAQVESKESRLGHEGPLKIDSKRKMKSSKKNHEMDTHDLNLDAMKSSKKNHEMDTHDLNLDATLKSEFSHNQHSRRQSRDSLDLDQIIEKFCHLKDACSMMHDNDGEVHAQSNQKHVISENIARDVIREFMNLMILNGKDLEEARKFLSSHELKEALQLLSSDKELFLTLLQNPNSFLLKCVQEFANSQGTNDKEYGSVAGSNFPEQGHGNLEQTREIVNSKQRHFFRKKVKSQSKSPANENGNIDFSSRIVILKPGLKGLQNSGTESNLASSLDSHDFVKHKGPSVRGSSHFSLTEIKKKLKHAMGKERNGNPEGISKKYPAESHNKRPGSRAICKDNVGMKSPKSPNKDHFFIEKAARPTFGFIKGDKTSTLKDSEVIVGHDNVSYPKQRVSNLYIEAKKHLCEMLGNGDENIDFSCRQIHKTLGRMLSLPEYNFSPLGSPGRDWEQHFVTAQKRFSAPDKANEDNFSPKQATFVGHLDQETNNPEKQSDVCDESSNNKGQEIESQLNFSNDLSHVEEAGNCYPVRDETVTEVNIESVTEINVLESSSEPVSVIAGKDQNHDISEIPDGARYSQCLKQEVTEENRPSSPLSSPFHSSITKKLDEPESGTDISGRPSPVSVLDIPFLEDDINPDNFKFHPVKVPVRQLQIQFEEQDSSPVNQIKRGKYCLEENELIYDYIKAVLQASGLTRDQLLMKCLSSDKILDPFLFDQVKFSSNKLCHDQELLHDCINEALMEVCRYYFGVSPWVSFVNPSIRPTPNMKKVILKVWEGVCWHFLPLPPPRALDQIVRKDMEKSGTWMDLRFDAEAVSFEMGEAILTELMEDTILSCVSKSTESSCSRPQFDEQNQCVEDN